MVSESRSMKQYVLSDNLYACISLIVIDTVKTSRTPSLGSVEVYQVRFYCNIAAIISHAHCPSHSPTQIQK